MARKKGPRGYQTKKSAGELFGECQELLAQFGAESVHANYEDGEPVEIAFVLKTTSGTVPYRFAPDIEGVRRRLDSGPSGRASAEAVAWFQTRQMLEALLELNESGLASTTTLLAGMAVTETGQTVGQMIEERPGDLLQGGTLLIGSGGSAPA